MRFQMRTQNTTFSQSSVDGLSGRITRGPGRRPRTVEETRVCAADDCETLLNRYNRTDFCYVHQGPRFPRVRGHNLQPL
jgi:hypothetical protein